MKKLILLIIVMTALYGCSKNKLNDMEQDYYTAVHDFNKIYSEYAEKTSTAFHNLYKNISDNKSINIDEALKTLEEEKNTAINKLKEKANNIKTQTGKELLDIKMQTINVVTESSKKALEDLKTKGEKTEKELKTAIEANIQQFSGKILELQKKEDELFKKLESLVDKK